MPKQSTLEVEGLEIRFYSENDEDFISLTDIARRSNPRTEQVIQNWLRNRNTVEFLGLWESLNNPGFNHLEFEVIRSRSGLNAFTMSVGEWVSATSAVGLRAKAGRYGGTFAHKDIAFEFGSWLSPAFKLLVIREFQRLKGIEAEQQKVSLDWEIRRTFAKINYHVHADAVQNHLVPPLLQHTRQEGFYFASEADLLNLALFGTTASAWRASNPEAKGNLRDHASAEQLLVLANPENLNAEFIRQGLSNDERLERLNEVAIHQMQLLVGRPALKNLGAGD